MDASFLALAKLSPIGVFWATAGGEWTYLNAAGRDLLGLHGEGVSRWLAEVVQTSRRSAGRAWRTAITEGRALALNVPVVRGSGVHSVRLEAQPIRDEGGAIRGWAGTVQSMKAERTVEDHAATLLATVPDMIFELDALDRYCGFHAGIKQEPLLPPGSFMGRHLSDVLPQAVTEGLLAAAQRAKELGEVQSVVFDLDYPSGVRTFEGRVSALHSGGWVGLARDVSEIVEQDEKLRTALLAAEAASDAKSRFLGNMSHELRTPLNGVLGMAQLIRDSGPLAAEQAAYLDVLQGCGESLLAIIEDLLDISRVESGKAEFLKVRVDLEPIVRQVMAAHQHETTKVGVVMTLDVTSSSTTVLGDPARIRQCVVNLVGNAVKFTPGGQVMLRIEHNPLQPGTLCLRVSDTGIGIPAHLLATIFEPFSQVDSTASRSFGGLGLGLSISTELARAMGGGISVVSREGEGSTFTFWLPVGQAGEFALAPEVRSWGPSGVANTAVHALRILVAEDNPASGLLLRLLLERAGHEVIVVEDGRHALEAVGENEFDVLMLDLHMPGLDGLQAARALQDTLGDGTPPLIAVTADALPTTVQRCTEAGFLSVLVKPFTADAVYEQLYRAVPAAIAGAIALHS